MSTLRQTPLTCSGHTRPVVFLAFSNINAEGQYYSISACKDGKPMLRSGATGDWIGTFEGHKGAVWGVDVNKDATKAATGAADFSAKVWDALSGEEELTLQHKHIVKSVNFSADSAALATGSNDKVHPVQEIVETPHIHATVETHSTQAVVTAHATPVHAVAHAPVAVSHHAVAAPVAAYGHAAAYASPLGAAYNVGWNAAPVATIA